MRESQLKIDRTIHAVYSPKARRLIRRELKRRYGSQRAEKLWEQIQHRFEANFAELGDANGKRGPHSASISDAQLVFAYYMTVPDKPRVDELQVLCEKLFMGSFEALGKVIDLSRPSQQKLLPLLARVFESVGEQDRAFAEAHPDGTGFLTENEPYNAERGIIRYRFTRCPNADFARTHGLLDILPAFCNCDHVGLGHLGLVLKRRHTCGIADECDYCIMSRSNPLAVGHRLETLPNGLLVSE